jgi:hypothetical protein
MSTILVDNLTGKTSAGDITVTSEGGAATQSLQQGLAKAWTRQDQRSTLSTVSSFNFSSASDVGTGHVQISFSNNMSDANYNVVGMNGYEDGTSNEFMVAIGLRRGVPPTSSTYNTQSVNALNSATGGTDSDNQMTAVFGDLA